MNEYVWMIREMRADGNHSQWWPEEVFPTTAIDYQRKMHPTTLENCIERVFRINARYAQGPYFQFEWVIDIVNTETGEVIPGHLFV